MEMRPGQIRQHDHLQSADPLPRVYTPETPISDLDLFSGRDDLLAECRACLDAPGTTLILYGDRGVGKTSLWKVLLSGRATVDLIASSDSTFATLFSKVLSRVGENLVVSERSTSAEGGLGIGRVLAKLNRSAKTVPVVAEQFDVGFLIERLCLKQDRLDAVVIDELQRVHATDMRDRIVEVAKAWADRGLSPLLVLVGMGRAESEVVNGEDLEHYLFRNVRAVRVDRMRDHETHDIMLRRAPQVPVTRAAEELVVELSCGYPWLVHRLMRDALLVCHREQREATVVGQPDVSLDFGVFYGQTQKRRAPGRGLIRAQAPRPTTPTVGQRHVATAARQIGQSMMRRHPRDVSLDMFSAARLAASRDPDAPGYDSAKTGPGDGSRRISSEVAAANLWLAIAGMRDQPTPWQVDELADRSGVPPEQAASVVRTRFKSVFKEEDPDGLLEPRIPEAELRYLAAAANRRVVAGMYRDYDP